MKRNSNSKSTGTSFLEIILSPEVSILVPLLILVAITTAKNPNFLTIKNIQVILRNLVFIGTLAIGQSLVIMCGDIDLSIGTNSTLTGVFFGVALVWWGLGFIPSLLLTIFIGLFIGGVNAFFTNVCKINSWIVTMATKYMCVGMATVITKGYIIPIKDWSNALYEWSRLRPLGGLSWPFFLFFGLIVIGEIAIRFTPIGRKIHAVGLNANAAVLDGINVPKVKAMCQITAGLMGAICGILQVANTNTATNAIGEGNEFPAVISAVIGGVSNTGGKGTMLGVLLGVIMYQTLKNCLQLMGANNNLQLVLLGLILILAVYVDVLKGKISSRARKAVAK